MKISIGEELKKVAPEYRTAVLFFDVKNDLNDIDGSYQYLYSITDSIRTMREEVLEGSFSKDLWEKLWGSLEIRIDQQPPAHISLLERLLTAEDIPNINILTNIANAISLKYGVPVGIHDISKVQGDITIGITSEDMPFGDRSKGETLVRAGEPAYFDERSILTRGLVSKQATTTLVNDNSRSIMVVFDSLKKDDDLESIAKDFMGAINRFLGDIDAKYGVISKEQSSIEVDSGEELVFETLQFKTYHISKDEEIIKRILHKAVEDVLPSYDMLEGLLRSGRRLRVYQGFDPTADTLHIGHAVLMRKLEDFRKLGHEVIMLIGDFTGRIGDPTDKSAARTKLTAEQVKHNLRSYKEQAKTLIDIDNPDNPVKVLFNNDWLGQMSFAEVIDLCSEFTVQQMLKRDMFQKRLSEDRPIFIHEFLYPLMQGWDSVHMGIDVEIGGNDQLFNMLTGRDLVIKRLHKQKIVLTGKLLTTDDGRKMGKSEGNMIKLSDSAIDIYGKVMAFSDDLILLGFELLTDASTDELEQIQNRLASGENPIILKKLLAFQVTSDLKDESSAKEAQKYFEEVFQNKSYDVEIPEVNVAEEEINILDLLKKYGGLGLSGSALRRLIEQGGVKVSDQSINKLNEIIRPSDGMVIRMGKNTIRIKKDRTPSSKGHISKTY